MAKELMSGPKYNPFSPPPRNSGAGLAARAIKNLETIMRAYEVGADVHVVTQVILSLQAIVVFPLGAKATQKIDNRPLTDESSSWAIKTDTYKGKHECLTLGVLLRRIRNAISHRGLTFSSDSRLLQDVTIEFVDTFNDKNTGVQYLWVAEISGDNLYKFCHYVFRLLKNVNN